jgi:hypothetical protein
MRLSKARFTSIDQLLLRNGIKWYEIRAFQSETPQNVHSFKKQVAITLNIYIHTLTVVLAQEIIFSIIALKNWYSLTVIYA